MYEFKKTIKVKKLDVKGGLPKIMERSFSDMTAGIGSFVSIRPCGDQYGGKTYLGILLGDISSGASVKYDEEKETLELDFANSAGNPAIFVPDLKQIIYGMESWWGKIKSPEDLKQISDAVIDNVWYVQALKRLEDEPEEAYQPMSREEFQETLGKLAEEMNREKEDGKSE